ncbi:MAG TPA: hypothetical protein VGX69_01685 [Solirubrobacteraceae bacterium]|jgi:hypothetical protein|nr:hypothetical protein [Solirubrobacteraceae bacterium]
MASGSATPPAEEPPRGPASVADGVAQKAGDVDEPPLGDERYGPLRVLRTHKDDGRSLIIYSREPSERAEVHAPHAARPPQSGA